jgi:hypothetical protein
MARDLQQPAFIDLYGYTVNESCAMVSGLAFHRSGDRAEIFSSLRARGTWNASRADDEDGQLVPTLMRADSIRDEAGKANWLDHVCTALLSTRWCRQPNTAAGAREALRDIAAALTSTLDLSEVLKRS